MRRVRQTASTVANPIRRSTSKRKPCPQSRVLESPGVHRDVQPKWPPRYACACAYLCICQHPCSEDRIRPGQQRRKHWNEKLAEVAGEMRVFPAHSAIIYCNPLPQHGRIHCFLFCRGGGGEAPSSSARGDLPSLCNANHDQLGGAAGCFAVHWLARSSLRLVMVC